MGKTYAATVVTCTLILIGGAFLVVAMIQATSPMTKWTCYSRELNKVATGLIAGGKTVYTDQNHVPADYGYNDCMIEK